MMYAQFTDLIEGLALLKEAKEMVDAREIKIKRGW